MLAAVGVCEHRLLDRVVRGRVWIGLVTFALLGIVTLQLGLLQLNGSIGRELARKAQLLREDSSLSIENSALASEEHVVAAATAAGMVPVPIKSLRFLDAHGASTSGASAALRAPVQPPSSETTSASAGGGEASSTGESANPNASQSSPSSSIESSSRSEASQPPASAPSSQTSEAGSASNGASAGAGEAGATGPVSEAGGSPAGGTSGG